MQRSFGLDLEGASLFFGTMLLSGGGVGVLLGGVIGDRVGRNNKRALATVPALCFLVAAPVFAAGILSDSLPLTFVLFSIPMALGYVWLAPVIGAVQHLVPAQMRTTATASFLFINNLLGPGLGIYILGGALGRVAAGFR